MRCWKNLLVISNPKEGWEVPQPPPRKHGHRFLSVIISGIFSDSRGDPAFRPGSWLQTWYIPLHSSELKVLGSSSIKTRVGFLLAQKHFCTPFKAWKKKVFSTPQLYRFEKKCKVICAQVIPWGIYTLKMDRFLQPEMQRKTKNFLACLRGMTLTGAPRKKTTGKKQHWKKNQGNNYHDFEASRDEWTQLRTDPGFETRRMQGRFSSRRPQAHWRFGWVMTLGKKYHWK